MKNKKCSRGLVSTSSLIERPIRQFLHADIYRNDAQIAAKIVSFEDFSSSCILLFKSKFLLSGRKPDKIFHLTAKLQIANKFAFIKATQGIFQLSFNVHRLVFVFKNGERFEIKCVSFLNKF